MKKCITFYEAQTAVRLKKITQPDPTHPPYHQILLLLWNKNFLTEIYRNIQTFDFKVFQELLQFLGIKKWYCAISAIFF